MIPAIVLTSSGPHRSLLRLPGDEQSVTSHLRYLLLAWLSHQFIIITRSVFANDKFVKLMQDVTRDKAEKDI